MPMFSKSKISHFLTIKRRPLRFSNGRPKAYLLRVIIIIIIIIMNVL